MIIELNLDYEGNGVSSIASLWEAPLISGRLWQSHKQGLCLSLASDGINVRGIATEKGTRALAMTLIH